MKTDRWKTKLTIFMESLGVQEVKDFLERAEETDYKLLGCRMRERLIEKIVEKRWSKGIYSQKLKKVRDEESI